MEPIKERLERILKDWDKLKVTVKQENKWQEVSLSKVKDQREIAKFIMLSISPYL